MYLAHNTNINTNRSFTSIRALQKNTVAENAISRKNISKYLSIYRNLVNLFLNNDLGKFWLVDQALGIGSCCNETVNIRTTSRGEKFIKGSWGWERLWFFSVTYLIFKPEVKHFTNFKQLYLRAGCTTLHCLSWKFQNWDATLKTNALPVATSFPSIYW